MKTFRLIGTGLVGILALITLSAYSTGDLVLSGQSFVGKPAYGTLASTPSPTLLTVDIVTQDVFVEVLPVTAPVATNSPCFDEVANGRLRYTCATTRVFFCNTTISAHTDAGANQDLMLRLAISGAAISTSDVYFVSANSADSSAIFTLAQVQLAQNEYVSVFAANHSSTQDIDIETFRISCWPLDQ